jgi:hypothetical protein
MITHSSAVPFDNVDPSWRTYCGLTADEMVSMVVLGLEGQPHSWAPDGQMTCARCREQLPRSLDSEIVEEWLTS